MKEICGLWVHLLKCFMIMKKIGIWQLGEEDADKIRLGDSSLEI